MKNSFLIRKIGIVLLALGPVVQVHSLRTAKQPERESETLHPWSVSEKLYALSTAWTEVKRNGAHLKNIGEERWDSLYYALLEPAVRADDDAFSHLMARFLASLKDGHTRLGNNRARNNWGTTNYFCDRWFLSLAYCDNQVMVVGTAESKTSLVPLGSVVDSVDGRPVKDVLAERMTEIPASTDAARCMSAASRLFQGEVGKRRTAVFRRPDGTRCRVVLENGFDGNVTSSYFTNFMPIDRDPLIRLSWPEKDVALLTIRSFGNRSVVDDFERMFPEIKRRARKVIIDISRNGGGNDGYSGAVISRFLEGDSVSGGVWSTPLYKAAFASWGAHLQPKDTVGNAWARECYTHFKHRGVYVGENKIWQIPWKPEERLIVPTVILTSVHTASACEDMLVLTEGQRHIVRMGQTTNGSTGNPIFFQPIRGLNFQVCTIDETYPDGRPFIGVGIRPHIEVPATYENLRKKGNYLVEAALGYLNGKKK